MTDLLVTSIVTVKRITHPKKAIAIMFCHCRFHMEEDTLEPFMVPEKITLQSKLEVNRLIFFPCLHLALHSILVAF